MGSSLYAGENKLEEEKPAILKWSHKDAGDNILEEEKLGVAEWLYKELGLEEQECDLPHINSLKRHGFQDKNDFFKEYIVVASTCATGNAGPDVHMVLSPDWDQGHKQMNFIAWQIPDITGKLVEAAKFECNCNYTLEVEDDMLVAIWRDSSGRKEPAMKVYYLPIGEYTFAVSDIVYGK